MARGVNSIGRRECHNIICDKSRTSAIIGGTGEEQFERSELCQLCQVLGLITSQTCLQLQALTNREEPKPTIRRKVTVLRPHVAGFDVP